jgi:hypothetical protein
VENDVSKEAVILLVIYTASNIHGTNIKLFVTPLLVGLTKETSCIITKMYRSHTVAHTKANTTGYLGAHPSQRMTGFPDIGFFYSY